MFSKDFIAYLMRKPDTYLLVWAFFYANADREGVFTYPYNLILVRFKISRSNLQRIVDYGCDWAESGQKVGRKWADKVLEIKFLDSEFGQELGRNLAGIGQDFNTESQVAPETTKKKRKPAQAKEKSSTLFQQVVAKYDDFCKDRIGMGAKMNALQGKAVKNIVSYLSAQVKLKTGDASPEQIEAQVFGAWSYVLDNWSSITPFYGQQIKLNQIDSNLPNILMELRKNNKSNRDDKFAQAQQQVGAISFE